MIDERTATRLTRAFEAAGLGFPPPQKGIDALARQLAQSAASEEHAKAAVTAWIENFPNWPKPSELRQMCLNTSYAHESTVAKERGRCEYCHGDGFVSVDCQYGLTKAAKCTHGPEMAEVTHGNPKISRSMESHYMAELRRAEPLRDAREGTSGHVDLAEIRRIVNEQEAARNPTAAEELARQLGIVK